MQGRLQRRRNKDISKITGLLKGSGFILYFRFLKGCQLPRQGSCGPPFQTTNSYLMTLCNNSVVVSKICSLFSPLFPWEFTQMYSLSQDLWPSLWSQNSTLSPNALIFTYRCSANFKLIMPIMQPDNSTPPPSKCSQLHFVVYSPRHQT